MTDSFDLILSKDIFSYKISSLSFDKKNNQFYYHFAWPIDTKKKGYFINKKELQGWPDHISFHQDGRVHLKYKQEKFNKRYHLFGNAPDQSFLPKNPNLVTPLLIDTVYWHPNEGWALPKLSVSEYHWKFNDFESFSILFFLMNKKISPSDYLNDTGLSVFWKTFTQVIQLECFNDWNIIAMLSDFVPNRPDPFKIPQSNGDFKLDTIDRQFSVPVDGLHSFQKLRNFVQEGLLLLFF